MRAILKDDMIVNVCGPDKGVEIGLVPKGVGFERVRFDGQNIVDLATLTQMYVRETIPGFSEFHILPIGQLVQMTYRDRNKLITQSDGKIRVKTVEELSVENLNLKRLLLKNQLRKRLENKTGDIEDQLADAYKLIFALIVYTRTNNSTLGNFFDSIINDVKEVYPLSRVRDKLAQIAKDLKAEMVEYYSKLGQMQ